MKTQKNKTQMKTNNTPPAPPKMQNHTFVYTVYI